MYNVLRCVSTCFAYYLLLAAHLRTSTAHSRQLRGRRLRCCTLIEAPIVFADPKSKIGFDGLALEYLRLLQDRLQFSCSSFSLFKDQLHNATGFTPFIKQMEACSEDGHIKTSPHCQCDIGVGGWMLNKERMGRVDFLPPFALDDFKVLVNVDYTETSADGIFFLTSFSSKVWLSIVMLAVVFMFLKLLDRRFAPPDHSFVPLPASEPRFRRYRHFLLKSRVPFRLRRAVQSTLSKMIGQSAPDIVGDYSSTRQWVLNFAIVLCGLFLILAYEATMTASLVQGTIRSGFRTVEDFKTCRVSGGDVCLPRGGVVEAFWNTAIATEDCYKKEGQKGPTMCSSYEEVISRTASRECKFMLTMGATAGNAAHGRYCGTLVPTGEPFFGGGLSYVLPLGSNMTKPMSDTTLQLKEEDAIPTTEKYLERRGLCHVGTKPTLTFKKLQVFFFLAFGACFLIFLEMVIDPQAAIRQRGENENKKEIHESASAMDSPSGKDGINCDSEEGTAV